MWPTPEQLNAVGTLITTIGAVIALIIHAIRVPYRESAAQEQVAATDSILRVRQARRTEDQPAHPPIPPAA